MGGTTADKAKPGAHSVLIDHGQANAISWARFRDAKGVQGKLFWEDPQQRSSAGLMRLDPGAGVALHTHRRHDHHVLVLSGSCRVEGKEVEAGAYHFVPAGTEHGIESAGKQGCTIFYLYLG